MHKTQDGGAIYQTKIGTITFNGMATFFFNEASNVRMTRTVLRTGTQPGGVTGTPL